jgi:hypothetical protein
MRDIFAVVGGKKDWSIGDAETWRVIPFIGGMYYLYFGGGEKRQRKKNTLKPVSECARWALNSLSYPNCQSKPGD